MEHTHNDHDPKKEPPVSYAEVNDTVLKMLEPPGTGWFLLLFTCLFFLAIGASCWFYQMWAGFGESGKSHPIGWGTYITNFVFWVGIAHSGTLISAVLYLFRANFRQPIYRLAEAMTVFAVMTAGLFPIIHLGRPWYALWLIPYPNQRALWPNFRSPLLWDVFAVSTYFTISATFFFVGLIPDIAAARDRATTPFRKILYGATSLGWRGSHTQWKHYTSAYLIFAAFATPLVVSVHSVVSWIFSGVAMVITLIIPLRKAFNLHRLITPVHFDAMSKLILLTSGVVSYSYITEFYTAWFSNNTFERFQFWFRPFGEYWTAFWGMTFCNCIFPQLLWIKSLRTNIAFLFILSIFINIGMWLERFNIIFQSLTREFIPAAWGGYNFSWIEIGITVGAFGWFGMWMTLFIKYFPSVAITEIKEVLPPPMRKTNSGAHH
jgi:molybdopterin-containing oxidoreductase family membrane subunit